MKTILLVGATGLVGQSVLASALADPRVTRLVAPTRRPLAAYPKLTNPLVDFDALPADAPWWSADAVICTLGTTIKKAGSPAAFRRVDYDYPLGAGRVLVHGGNDLLQFATAARGTQRLRTQLVRWLEGRDD